jgi:hypothetical protein
MLRRYVAQHHSLLPLPALHFRGEPAWIGGYNNLQSNCARACSMDLVGADIIGWAQTLC